MSTPIRPAGGPLAPGVAGVEGPAEIETSGVGPSAAAHAPSSVGAADGSQVHGATANLLARLEAGEVTREQAIEGLVRSALETHGGQHLPPSQRVELEAVLRAALLDDPTLARLLG